MVDNAAAVSALGLSPETTLVFCVVALLIVGAIVVIVASKANFGHLSLFQPKCKSKS